jgi:hypothetical protein
VNFVAVVASWFQNVPLAATGSPQLLETQVVENRQNSLTAETVLGTARSFFFDGLRGRSLSKQQVVVTGQSSGRAPP